MKTILITVSILINILILNLPVQGQISPDESSRIGLAEYGQTTVLDNRFNPALSFLGDMVATWSDESGREAGADGFKLRGAEIGLFGAVDNAYEFHGILFFGEEEVELEEAYVIATDWFTPSTHIKAGRFNMDFGKLSPVHDGELPTLDKPSVLQEYIGGTVRGTGAEMHWWSPLGEASLLRGSLGIFQTADTDAHVILGPGGGHHGHAEEEDEEEGPLREFEDFAINARLTTLVDVAETTTLQLGGSYLMSPERLFGVDDSDIQNVDQSVMGLDLTLITENESVGSGYRFQAEALVNDRDYGELDDAGTPGDPVDDVFQVSNQEATGYYLLAERKFNPKHSIGLSYNQYEHAEDSAEESSDFGIYFTKHLNEYNRLRFEIRSFKDLAFEEDGIEELVDFTAFSIQWSVMLGSHGHGLEW